MRLVLLVLAGLLPLLAFTLVEEYIDYRAAVDRTGRDTLVKARTLSDAVDAELDARIRMLEVLATSTRLRLGEIDDFRRRAEAVVAQHYPGANIVVLQRDGQQLMNLDIPAGTRLPVRPHLATIERVFATAEPAVSDLYRAAALQRLVVSIDVPVLDEDGRVTAVLSMVPAAGAFDSLLTRHQGEDSSVVAVFDRQFMILARSPNPDRHIGQKAGPSLMRLMPNENAGIVNGSSQDGIPVLAAFSRSQRHGWTVSIGVPRANLIRPAVQGGVRALAFACTLLLFGIVLAALVARGISRPIAMLGELAAKTEGNSSLPSSSAGLREVDQVAEALRASHEKRLQSEHRFRTLFEVNPMAMCVYDLETLEILEVNNSMVELYGWGNDELLQLKLPDIWPSEDRRQLLQQVAARHRGQFSLKQLRKDGSRFDAEAFVRVIDLAGRRVGLSTCQDVTARKSVEEQLRQAQKMETLGQLAGGVAHDFNNSLAVVMASFENLLDPEIGERERRDWAETGLQATQQAASLTRRLLAFARRQELVTTEIDVGAVVTELQEILRSSVSRTIDLTIRAAAGESRCMLDRTELETAVINLVINARDAVGERGKIMVETSDRTIGKVEAREISNLKVGRWCTVSVADNGTGMTPEIKSRMFEPFFTTKEVGKGTGLGLSQIHGFVSQSGGFISVETAAGGGTQITLHFPVHASGAIH